jgi:hypothetical protein
MHEAVIMSAKSDQEETELHFYLDQLKVSRVSPYNNDIELSLIGRVNLFNHELITRHFETDKKIKRLQQVEKVAKDIILFKDDEDFEFIIGGLLISLSEALENAEE